jgi:hypothetical protein
MWRPARMREKAFILIQDVSEQIHYEIKNLSENDTSTPCFEVVLCTHKEGPQTTVKDEGTYCLV